MLEILQCDKDVLDVSKKALKNNNNHLSPVNVLPLYIFILWVLKLCQKWSTLQFPSSQLIKLVRGKCPKCLQQWGCVLLPRRKAVMMFDLLLLHLVFTTSHLLYRVPQGEQPEKETCSVYAQQSGLLLSVALSRIALEKLKEASITFCSTVI